MTQNGTPVRIRHFTDPMCPFAFSAERQRLRLQWLYGDQLGWSTHMVVLAEQRRADYPPERLAQGRRRLHERYGMPMAWTPPPAVAASLPASRAVVAVRERGGEQRCGGLLRRLRVLYFSGLALDEPETLDRAAVEAGLDPEELRAWSREPAVAAAVEADKRAARNPSPASRAQDYKLGGPPEERRYTCPSYEIERTTPAPPGWSTAERVDLPGFRPVEAYEAALANLAPELTRRPDPDGVEEVLAWAEMPLATAEVAAVMDIDLTDAREALARVARFEPVGADGYWTRSAPSA
jgi:2-hydroxychromene-2-carboxylate isomerase